MPIGVGAEKPARGFSPEGLGGVEGLVGDRLEVAAIASRRREARGSVCAASVVKLEELGEEDGDGPTVEEDVMAGEDAADGVVGDALHPYTCEWRAGEVEASSSVLLEVRLEASVARVRVLEASVDEVDREACGLVDDLGRAQ